MSKERRKTTGAEEKSSASGLPALPDTPPQLTLVLTPHQSLTPVGFAWIIGLLGTMFLVPLMAVLGTIALWGLLPFVLAAVAGLWYFMQRNVTDQSVTEELNLWPELITVTRKNPRTAEQNWHANPYWTSVHLHKSARIKNYLTLKGNGREIELGAFLSPGERRALCDQITTALARANSTSTQM